MLAAARSDRRFLPIFTDSVVMIKVAIISQRVICNPNLLKQSGTMPY